MPPRKKARTHAPSTSSSFRHARRARSPEPLQAPAAELPNNKASLPADLAYTIVAYIVGDFFQDIILDPKNASEEDVIGTMLHVSRAFREFTIKFLRLLWGETFFIGSTLTNYKSAICTLRELATAPYQKPHKFVKRVSIPALNSRVVRRRSGILIDLALYLLDGVAYREMGRKQIGGPPIGVNIFDPKALSVLRDNYHKTVPSLLRPLLLGRVWDKIVKWAIIWPRAPLLYVSFHWVLALASSLSGSETEITLWADPPYDRFSDLNPVPDELEPRLRAALEKAQKKKELCDEELADFRREEGLHHLPSIALEDFPLDDSLFKSLDFFERVANYDEPHAKVIHIARKCIGLFLSEDEEARFVGEREASQDAET